MNRLSDSVKKIRQSEESREQLLALLDEKQAESKNKGFAVRRLPALAASFVLLAAALAVGLTANRVRPAAGPQTGAPISAEAQDHLELRIAAYRADGQLQPLALGEEQTGESLKAEDRNLAWYAFRTLNITEYDDVFIGVRSTSAKNAMQNEVIFGIGDNPNTESMKVGTSMVFETPENGDFKYSGLFQFYSKEKQSAAENSAAFCEQSFYLSCPKNGETVYTIVAYKYSDAGNTLTAIDLKLSAVDGVVTAELLSQDTRSVILQDNSQMQNDGESRMPSVPSTENTAAES